MENTSTPHRCHKDSILAVVNREIEESIATKQELRKEMVNEIAEVGSLLVMAFYIALSPIRADFRNAWAVIRGVGAFPGMWYRVKRGI